MKLLHGPFGLMVLLYDVYNGIPIFVLAIDCHCLLTDTILPNKGEILSGVNKKKGKPIISLLKTIAYCKLLYYRYMASAPPSLRGRG